MHFARPTSPRIEPRADLLDKIRERMKSSPVNAINVSATLAKNKPINRAFGPYAWAYWTMFTCNVIIPQVFWIRWARVTPWFMFIISIFVNIGMWFERFVITITSLSRDFLPANWGYYTPTYVDVLTFVGSFGLFLTLFLLFCRFLPIVAMAEVKATLPDAHVYHPEEDH